MLWRSNQNLLALKVLLCAVVLSALFAGSTSHAQGDAPALEGPAYLSADEAYTAFNAGDFTRAANKVRESIALRPDVLRLRLLLADALAASGEIAEARRVVDEATRELGPAPDLESRRIELRRRLAQKPAENAYKALAAGDVAAAQRAARLAAETAPDVMAYRLLLLSSQRASDDFPESLKTATAAITLDRSDYVPLVWRAYISQRMGDRKSAVADFEAALALPNLSGSDRKNITLIAVDAALISADAATALRLLRGLPGTDPDVAPRLADAEGASSNRGSLPDEPKNAPPPTQDCKSTAAGVVCSLQAAPARSILVIDAPAAEPAEPAAAGFEAADRAYKAKQSGNNAAAIRAAEEAVRDAPENISYRLLLTNLLSAAGRYRAAEAAASEALALDQSRGEVFAQRGFIRNKLNNPHGAIADWQAALASGLPTDQMRIVRLSLADAALKTKQPKRALDAIAPLRADYEVSIRRAYALQALGRKPEALAAFKLAATSAANDAQRVGALKAQIALLVELDRKAEAGAILRDAKARGLLRQMRDVDLAYLFAQVGDDAAALHSFDVAREKRQLPPRGALDAGYSAKRQFQNAKAIDYFAEAIDAAEQGRLALDAQRLFDTRREVSSISRVWGINTSVLYGKVGSAPNPFAIVTPSGGYTSQVGTEIYYRPEPFGYRNGATFDLFTRFFATLYDEQNGPTGSDSAQGMVGARWKPFSEHNLVFEVDKLFKYGKFARDDTLLRAAYSYSAGTDLRVVDPNWLTWQVYGEVNRYLENPQLVALAEGRFGRSFRLDAINQKLVFFPHVVAAASYDDSFAGREAYGIGAGSSMRYWFGETKYTAPPSYLELTLQYRFRVAGDKRAEGVFAQALVNY